MLKRDQIPVHYFDYDAYLEQRAVRSIKLGQPKNIPDMAEIYHRLVRANSISEIERVVSMSNYYLSPNEIQKWQILMAKYVTNPRFGRDLRLATFKYGITHSDSEINPLVN